MEEVQVAVNQTPYLTVSVDQAPYSNVSLDQAGPSKERPVKASLTTPRRKIQVIGQAIVLGKLELNVVVKDIGDVDFDFSVVPMYQLHTIQHVALEEMKTREHNIFDQLNSSKKIMSSLKHSIKETENKAKNW